MDFGESLAAWGTPEFPAVFREEVRENSDGLPLQQGLVRTNHALTEKLDVMVIGVREEGDFLIVKAGIFFEGILTGCGCADDPTPIEPQREYCEMLFRMDKNTGETSVSLSEERDG